VWPAVRLGGTDWGQRSAHRLHLGRVDPHWLLHQEGIALVEQVVGDPGHLPVPPECYGEVGAGCRQHLPVVCEGRRASHLGRSSRDEIGIGILDGDQLYVRHE
jgi:hypothetical protein